MFWAPAVMWCPWTRHTQTAAIEIAITGLRPGEKLYEEVLIGDNPTPTSHPRIMKAHEDHLSWPILKLQLQTLRCAADNSDVAAVKAVLLACVHRYGEPVAQAA